MISRLVSSISTLIVSFSVIIIIFLGRQWELSFLLLLLQKKLMVSLQQYWFMVIIWGYNRRGQCGWWWLEEYRKGQYRKEQQLEGRVLNLDIWGKVVIVGIRVIWKSRRDGGVGVLFGYSCCLFINKIFIKIFFKFFCLFVVNL